ncbi:unnamed protein product [Ranitomeya imitator]|uniref:Vimentin n=1 Tax=Ranitomeya imitator TaxID=111125 RepID=A0ABN9KQS8_9NEOB|nr:unnamed protein product [Ranitomeya imitator]
MSSPSTIEVKEAFDAHLSAVYGQVDRLEGTVREQAESLIRKDEQYRASMNDMVEAKDRTIALLQKKLAESEEEIKNMKASIKAKDRELKCRRHHSQLLIQMCRNRARLNNLVALMEDTLELPCFPNVEQCALLPNVPHFVPSDDDNEDSSDAARRFFGTSV